MRDAIRGLLGVARAIETIVRDEPLADLMLIGAERRRVALQQPCEVLGEQRSRRLRFVGLQQRREQVEDRHAGVGVFLAQDAAAKVKHLLM